MKKKPDMFKDNIIINEYILELELKGLRDSSITSKLWQLSYFFKFIGDKAVEDITREDVERYALLLKREVKEGKRKHTTENNLLIALRQFVQWKFPGSDHFKRIKITPCSYNNPEKKWATREDVLKMLKVCNSQRDRALLLLLMDSGARVSELLDLNRKDFLPDQYGGTINVKGKTGKRTIRIVDSVPDLQLYMNQTNGNHGDPLFISYNGRLTVRGVQNMLIRLQKRAGIEYKIHPHSLRHLRLTELSNNGVSEMMLRRFAGWEATSNMPAVYVNPTAKELDQKLLGLSGVEVTEEVGPDLSSTHAVTCPRCKTKNSFDSKFCSSCSFILDTSLALETKTAIQRSTELADITAMLLNVANSENIEAVKTALASLREAIENEKTNN